MPEGGAELTVDIPADGGTTTTATTSTGTPVTFTLPAEYTIAGGIIGNGVVTFRAGTVTCTYRGQSSTARPETADELIKGTLLKFQSCSDGQPASATRSGTQFELTVNPIPDYPVTVQPPLQRPDLRADRMELLTPERTRAMRQGFNWSSATRGAGNNPDGTPTLYYAWIHIRNKTEALSLKKLFIHVLNRPLFDEELTQYAGKCGTFTNPGDGEGMFVPAVIPGKTYNKLIDALTSGDVSGDRVIFDAVILRQVPAAARNPNNSINLRLLAESGFRYLDYEVSPFAPDNEIVLEGGASKVFTDALAWVAQAGRDVGEVVTGLLNELDQLVRGEVEVELWVHALTSDPLFSGVMKRGWGTYAGQPMGTRVNRVVLRGPRARCLANPSPTAEPIAWPIRVPATRSEAQCMLDDSLGQGMALLDGARAYQKAVFELSLLSLVPLVFVAWRTSFRVVVAAALILALVETAFLAASSLAKDQVDVALHVLWGRTIGMVFAGYVIARLAGEQRGQHRELLAAHARLKANAINLELLAVSRERNRLARELHDTLAHRLSGIAVQLAAARALLGDDDAQAGTRIEATREQAREGLCELRRAMHDLRSSPLDELGLCLALARLLSTLEQRAGIGVKADWPARPVTLPADVEHGV